LNWSSQSSFGTPPTLFPRDFTRTVCSASSPLFLKAKDKCLPVLFFFCALSHVSEVSSVCFQIPFFLLLITEAQGPFTFDLPFHLMGSFPLFPPSLSLRAFRLIFPPPPVLALNFFQKVARGLMNQAYGFLDSSFLLGIHRPLFPPQSCFAGIWIPGPNVFAHHECTLWWSSPFSFKKTHPLVRAYHIRLPPSPPAFGLPLRF